MNYDWIENYCLALPSTTKEYKAEWDAILYKVGGKFFAMVGNDAAGNDIISVKLSPDEGLFMREKYEDIQPGYYLNKTHWNSIALSGRVPQKEMETMLNQSYKLVFASLTKKLQNQIMENN